MSEAGAAPLSPIAVAPSDPGPAVTTLYNGSCPVCRVEIRSYQALCERRAIRLGWVDITQAPGQLAELGLDPEAVRRRLHVLDAVGTLHIGVDAFLALWAQMPGWRRLVPIVGHPWLKPVARSVYDRVLAPALFAWNRAYGR